MPVLPTSTVRKNRYHAPCKYIRYWCRNNTKQKPSIFASAPAVQVPAVTTADIFTVSGVSVAAGASVNVPAAPAVAAPLAAAAP